MTANNEFRDVITKSVELEKSGEHASAMKLLDEAIAEAIQNGDVRWIRTLCNHAAVTSRFHENWDAAKRYYQQSLSRTQKMPERCTDWQLSLSIKVTP